MASSCKTLLNESKCRCKAYFDGRMSVEHVLQIEVAAVVQVLLAEVLDELQVVQTVCQRHGLFQANVCKSKTIRSATLITETDHPAYLADLTRTQPITEKPINHGVVNDSHMIHVCLWRFGNVIASII